MSLRSHLHWGWLSSRYLNKTLTSPSVIFTITIYWGFDSSSLTLSFYFHLLLFSFLYRSCRVLLFSAGQRREDDSSGGRNEQAHEYSSPVTRCILLNVHFICSLCCNCSSSFWKHWWWYWWSRHGFWFYVIIISSRSLFIIDGGEALFGSSAMCALVSE